MKVLLEWLQKKIIVRQRAPFKRSDARVAYGGRADGRPAHKARMVKSFVAENSDAIELFFLPPYAPELNPDELAWAHLKTKIVKVTAKTKEELKLTVDSALHRLQKLPEIVASFFRTPSCKYVAA